MRRQEKTIFVVGPTASGKSALALQLARRFDGEIVCADSRTVYKGMDIGTAKPSAQDQELVPHHLLDVVKPDQPFTVAQFKELAEAAITDIMARGKVPIVVGGSGLYVDALLFNFTFRGKADAQLRHTLEQLDLDELQKLCSSKNIDIKNAGSRRYLIRALETHQMSPPKQQNLRRDVLVVGIATDRTALLSRIISRTHEMFRLGVLEEAKRLAELYGWESEAMTSSIYRTLRPVVEGDMPLHTAIERFIKSDMSLAKRQMTWFKRNSHIVWGEPAELIKKVAHFLS